MLLRIFLKFRIDDGSKAIYLAEGKKYTRNHWNEDLRFLGVSPGKSRRAKGQNRKKGITNIRNEQLVG
jgi:hypothetical protein